MNLASQLVHSQWEEIDSLTAEIFRLNKENQELREAVGRMQGLLNLQEKIGDTNGQS